MRTTLFFKRLDLILQFLALAIPVACSFWQPYYAFYAYYTVGIAQVISVLLNRLFLDNFLRHSSRIGCEIAAVLLVIYFSLIYTCDNIEGLFIFLYALLFIAPWLAAWYGIISYYETRQVSSRVDRKQYL